MPGKSKKTKVMMVRLPNDVAERIEQRAAKQLLTVSEYLRKMIVLQAMRKR